MSGTETVSAPPMWKSFLVGFFLFGIVLGPLVGMVFYFYRPVTDRMGWYVGTSLPFGFVIGLLLAAVVALVFARKASG